MNHILLFCVYLLTIFLSSIGVNCTKLPTTQECTSRIDHHVDKINSTIKNLVITVKGPEPCSECSYHGLLDFTRANIDFVEAQEQDDEITYSVTITNKRIKRVCRCNIDVSQRGIYNLIYGTAIYNPVTDCNIDVSVPVVTTVTPNKKSGLWFLPKPVTISPSKRKAQDQCSWTVSNFKSPGGRGGRKNVRTYKFDLDLNAEIENSCSKYTIVVNSTGHAKITAFEILEPPSEKFNYWCSGLGYNKLLNLCSCILKFDNGINSFSRDVNKFLPCFVKDDPGFHIILDALNCIKNF